MPPDARPDLACSRSISNRHQRVLEAIRRHFRDVGASPTYREIEARSGVRAKYIGGSLGFWQRRGALTFTAGKSRSIQLVDRSAMLSDSEIELAVIGRGGRVVWSYLPVFADAFPVPVVDDDQDYGQALLDRLP